MRKNKNQNQNEITEKSRRFYIPLGASIWMGDKCVIFVKINIFSRIWTEYVIEVETEYVCTCRENVWYAYALYTREIIRMLHILYA